jgi:hypothetical protein
MYRPFFFRPGGERVEIFAQDRFSGTLFGIEDRPVPGAGRIPTKGEADSSPSEAPTEPFVTLYTDRGLTSIPLRKIKSLRFLNPSLDMEISTALQYLAENRNTDRKRILIRYGGASTRSLRLGYIVESPVWKTAFRLVLGEGQKHLLQGWAIVENPTDEDWNGVRLDLVSGRPISFSMNLYEPIYNPRPRIPYAVEKQAVPPVSSAGVTPGASPALPQAALKSAPSASASPQVKRSRIDTMAEALSDKSLTAKAEESGASSEIAQEGEEFLSPEKMGSGPRPEADAAAVGQFIRYTIQEPVTLPRRQAALLPILNASLEGERFSIYNESLNRKYPLSGFWLKNTSGLPLMGGPITVFEGGQYAGDGRIDTVSAGDRRLVSYAVDLEREVLFLDKTEPETITRVKIQKGNTPRFQSGSQRTDLHPGEPGDRRPEHPDRTSRIGRFPACGAENLRGAHGKGVPVSHYLATPPIFGNRVPGNRGKTPGKYGDPHEPPDGGDPVLSQPAGDKPEGAGCPHQGDGPEKRALRSYPCPPGTGNQDHPDHPGTGADPEQHGSSGPHLHPVPEVPKNLERSGGYAGGSAEGAARSPEYRKLQTKSDGEFSFQPGGGVT